MIPDEEQLYTLADAAALLPHRPHAHTLQRWIRKGVRGVKLEYISAGGRLLTSEQALRRFMRQVTEADTKRAERREGRRGAAHVT